MMFNNKGLKGWKPKSNKQVYNTYGRVFKITTQHLGVLLDAIIPMTFGLITLFFTKKFFRELFIITIKEV